MPAINAKRLRSPGRCIFCGSGGLTREHIWPRWAAELLPTSDHKISIRGTTDPRGNLVGDPRLDKRQGSLKGITVRVVCGSCNSGWMSAVEETAKPFLNAMSAGLPLMLDGKTTKAVVEWLVLKMMVAEHSPPAEPAFRAEANQAFFAARTVPDGVSVCLYRCGVAGWRTAYRRSAGTLSAAPSPSYDTRLKNAAGVTLGFGEMLIQCNYFGDPDLRGGPTYLTQGLSIWPYRAPCSWPPADRLSREMANDVAGAFDRLREMPQIRVVD